MCPLSRLARRIPMRSSRTFAARSHRERDSKGGQPWSGIPPTRGRQPRMRIAFVSSYPPRRVACAPEEGTAAYANCSALSLAERRFALGLLCSCFASAAYLAPKYGQASCGLQSVPQQRRWRGVIGFWRSGKNHAFNRLRCLHRRRG